METHASFIPKQLAQIQRFFDTHFEYVDVPNILGFICPSSTTNPTTTNTLTLFQLPNIPWNLTRDAPFPLWLWPSLKVGFKDTAFTPSTLSSAEPSRQMMWHGLKVELSILKHWPSHWYLDMRQECRTFKSIASRPCDWLLLVLAMRTQGASSTKTDGNIDL